MISVKRRIRKFWEKVKVVYVIVVYTYVISNIIDA